MAEDEPEPDHLAGPHLLFTAQLRRPARHLPRRAVQRARRRGAGDLGSLRRGAAAARRRPVEGLPARPPPQDRLLRRRLPAGDRRARPRGARAARGRHRLRARRPGHGPGAAAGRLPRTARRRDRGRRVHRPRRHPGRHPARLRQRLRPHRLRLLPHRRCRRAARAWLRGLLAARDDRRAVGRRQAARRRSTSRSPPTGCSALGVPDAVLATFSHEFRAGMAARADDAGRRRPQRAGQLGARAARRRPARARHGQRARRRRARARDHAPAQRRRERRRRRRGLRAAHRAAARLARALRLRRRLRAAGARRRRRRGRPAHRRRRPRGQGRAGARSRPASSSSATRTRTRASIPERALPSAPADPLGRSGTYMVWRKLYQDVALFRHVLREAAALYRRRRPREARGQGRRALAQRHAARPLPRRARSRTSTPRRASANDFRYAEDDPEGRRCPLGAHIRRTNPRDALGFDGLLSFRHRIIRRGMPYGRAAAAEGDRGRPRRPRPGLRLLQREHLAPVRGHPGAVDQRRQRLRPRPRQRLPAWATRTGRAR